MDFSPPEFTNFATSGVHAASLMNSGVMRVRRSSFPLKTGCQGADLERLAGIGFSLNTRSASAVFSAEKCRLPTADSWDQESDHAPVGNLRQDQGVYDVQSFDDVEGGSKGRRPPRSRISLCFSARLRTVASRQRRPLRRFRSSRRRARAG